MSIYRIFSSLCLAVCLLSSNSLYAQSEDKITSTNSATLIGIGNSNLYDTYLSPLKYKGTSLHIFNERMRKTSWFNNKFTRQQLIDLEITKTDNPAGNATQYSVLLGYSLGGHYNLVKTDKFRLSAGALWNISGGVLYNQRNSNNPASARAYSNIQLSAIAFYNWKQITFRGQLDTPVMGILFSPHYGQSYYEISLGNSVDVLNFASLHNQRGLRTYFTADIPISKISLRVGYLGAYYQTRIHNLQTHNYSNSFVIGLVSESINLSGNKIKTNKIINSSFY
uniref:DUF3316 domain-containing protein n=1 Tax=uncultured Dysgonomonas sp. TaxID=206096 RepID=UPI00260E9405|nr:DUF3316 domain-containing protein [uncultured Dysgonomonas sp.]